MSALDTRSGEARDYRPRVVSRPGEPLLVEVDLPEDPATGRPSDSDVFAAMEQAAALALPENP